MNKFIVTNLVLLSSLLPIQASSVPPYRGHVHDSPPSHFAPDRLLVGFQPGTSASDISASHQRAGAKILKVIPGIGVDIVQVPAGTVMEKIGFYKANPKVKFAEPDYNRILQLPNEQTNNPASNDFGFDYFLEQWGLNNTGQDLTDPSTGIQELYGANDADIDAPEGWDVSIGDPQVVIAMLDTGVDCANNLEFSGKCVDQQNFVSDYTGTTADILGHGTHTAGIAAAKTDNDIGVAGVGWGSSIANLKTCYAYEYRPYDWLPEYTVLTGVCPVSASAAAIAYAADQGYHVINMSYASDEIDPVTGEPTGQQSPPPNAESAAVTYAWDNGVVLVAAAGNSNNTAQIYPAAFPEVIAVAATDRYDDRASFSSFGNNWVSMLAPGESILSTIPNDFCVFYADLLGYSFDATTDACLDWNSGTSMASPHVAGAAALVWAHFFPNQLDSPSSQCFDSGTRCNAVVRSHLESGADKTGALGQNFQAWAQYGRLNLAGALGGAPTSALPPEAPDALVVIDNADGTATAQWTDSSDNETGFEIERQKLRKNNWTSTTQISAGENATQIVDPSGTGTFHYRVRAVNTAGTSGWTAWAQVVVTSVTNGGSGGGKGRK